MISAKDLTWKLILISRISFQEVLCDALVRLAAAFLLFSPMREHLKPKCLGGRFFRTKKARFQGCWTREAAFLARAALAVRRGTKS
jgi:hypothetical protein